MSWEKVLSSEIVQRLGITLIGFAVAYIVWQQMNTHIDGRFKSQDARIEHMEQENVFYRKVLEVDQEQRQLIFAAIAKHLEELTKRRPVSSTE